MNAKVTLSFNEDIIIKAKKFANKNNISLSRLTEFLLERVSVNDSGKKSLEDIPVASWINELSKGEIVYKTNIASRKTQRNEYFNSK